MAGWLIRILDGLGTGYEAQVTRDHALKVEASNIISAEEAVAIASRIQPFQQYMTQDGTPTGTYEMAVVGSLASPVDYFLGSKPGRTRFVTRLSWKIVDASAILSKFGNLSPLTNGIQVILDGAYGEVQLHPGIKTNFDLIRWCGDGAQPIGGAGDAFRASNVEGNSEAYMPNLDLTSIMPPNGVPLAADSLHTFKVRIRDDISGIDSMDVIAYGYEVIVE